jgi:hypothetical protein
LRTDGVPGVPHAIGVVARSTQSRRECQP